MLSVQSVIGCRLTFEKLLRGELWGGLRGKLLRAKLLRGGACCGSNYCGAGFGLWCGKICCAGWLQAKLLPGGAGCGPGDDQYAGCGLNCDLRGGVRTPISSLRRALIKFVEQKYTVSCLSYALVEHSFLAHHVAVASCLGPFVEQGFVVAHGSEVQVYCPGLVISSEGLT